MLRPLLLLAMAASFLGAPCQPPTPAPATTVPQRAAPAAAPESADAIGSLRGSRIAYPMPAGQKAPLTFLAGELMDEQRAELAAAAPNVRILGGLTRQQAMEHAAEADGVDARFATPGFLGAAKKLVWVQTMSAGVDHYLGIKPLVENEKIVLTNMRAVHGPAIADHAMAMLLTLTRNMRGHLKDQAEGRWARDDGPVRSQSLAGKTMLVVGIGGIGTEVAQRASGFGMRVIATRRTDTPSPAYVQRTGKPEDLMGMLPEADVVAICVPLTAETKGLIGREALARMKPTAILINVARGKVVDTEALLGALRSGNLGGACLDVTDPEPLPTGHLLWTMENVVITPHASADSELTDRRRWLLLRENVRRFGAGEPLMNVVDKQAGY